MWHDYCVGRVMEPGVRANGFLTSREKWGPLDPKELPESKGSQ